MNWKDFFGVVSEIVGSRPQFSFAQMLYLFDAWTIGIDPFDAMDMLPSDIEAGGQAV